MPKKACKEHLKIRLRKNEKTTKKNEIKSDSKWLKIIAIAAILVATATAYFQTISHDFILYDDPVYITENQNIQTNLTNESFLWAFKTTHGSNWHPITWLSHIIDYQLFKLNPGPHHLMNVFFHLTNTLLLFIVFKTMTKKFWPSAFIAAVFALHPLHVESVAWASERKDVLSTTFWFLTMLTYCYYAKKPSLKRYIPVILCFALGLMTKPMLVTLPLVLLLIDYWPLKRLRLQAITEKIPLFILTALSSIATMLAQQTEGSINVFPLSARISNTFISFAAYIAKSFWPTNLIPFYRHPNTIEPIPLVASIILLAVLTTAAVLWIKRRPYFFAGLSWFIVTLIPVIGLVQVGRQARADRYMYIPLIGLSIIIAYTCSELIEKRKSRIIFITAISIITLSALSVCTYIQTGRWKDTMTLFSHTAEVDPDNSVALSNLGILSAKSNNIQKAMQYNLKVVELRPKWFSGHTNLAKTYVLTNNLEKAIHHFQIALKLHPKHEEHFNLANTLRQANKTDKAIELYQKAINLNPNYAEAHNNLAATFTLQNKFTDAVKHYERALSIKPNYIEAHINYAITLSGMKKYHQAADHFQKALQLDPNNQNAQEGLQKAVKNQTKQ